MIGTLILTAVELEARALARELGLPALPSSSYPAFARGSVRVAPVGLRAALLQARWASLLGEMDRPLVISAGVCGALHPGLRRGDLVVPETVLGPAGERLQVTAAQHRRAMSRVRGSAHAGCLVTTSQAVSTPAAKSALRERTGAVAVDMESAVILSAAESAGCASLVLRGVSDDASQEVPAGLIALLGGDGRLRHSRALALTVVRPQVISRALELRRGTRQALRAVAGLLAALVAEGRPWTSS